MAQQAVVLSRVDVVDMLVLPTIVKRMAKFLYNSLRKSSRLVQKVGERSEGGTVNMPWRIIVLIDLTSLLRTSSSRYVQVVLLITAKSDY
jgi:hypothetical protein